MQDCFFLPVTSCKMGAAQWDRIRLDLRVRELTDVRIDLLNLRAPRVDERDLNVLFHMLFFRQNAGTRNEVMRREIAWRAQNPSWPKPESAAAKVCAALHVRHGDKLTPY